MKPAARSVLGPILAFAWLGCHASAQDTVTPGDATVDAPKIIGPVADGTPPPEPPPRPMPDVKVLNTVVRHEGGRTITMNRVEPPDLPELPPPVPPPDLSDPKVQEWLAKMRENARETRMAFVSATVYDHERTLLRWWLPGDPPKNFEAWSNIDFNHLCGFGSYEFEGVEYALLMGIGNMDTEKWRQIMANYGRTLELPESPELPVDRPAYLVTDGDTTDEDGMAIMEGLHHLYAREKDQLAAAYEARVQARIEREAYLKAHPPKPMDTVIHFWRRPREARNGLEGGVR